MKIMHDYAIAQVFGRKPYETAPGLSTPNLARLILRQYNLKDDQMAIYTRHVALLVSMFVFLSLCKPHI